MKEEAPYKELPKGWRLARFDEFLRRIDRKITIDDSALHNCVGVRWYGMGTFIREQLLGMNIARKQQWVIKAGDVVYNKLFAWKGAFAIADKSVDGCIVSDKFPTYEINPGVIDSRFLGHYFRTPQLAQRAQGLSKGAAAISKLTLNPPQFWDLTILLPRLEEQRRIVAKIEDLNVKIKEAVGLRRLVRDEVYSLFDAQLDSVFKRLAKNFSSTTLLDIVDPERGISYGVVLTGLDYEDGIPTLRAGDLRRFQVLLDGVKRIDPNIEAKYKRTRLRGNEVLLRIRGGLGEVAVCPNEMIGGNVSREIAVIPVIDHLDPYYLMFALAAPSSQDFMKSKVRGTSYVGINLKDVRRLPIPIPSIEEQKRIVAYFDELKAQVDAVNQLHAATATELEALMSSILDKAFKGEL
jgi:type I restriction enzyme S subunit